MGVFTQPLNFKDREKPKTLPCHPTTKEKLPTWLSTTVPDSASAVSLVTMLHEPSSHPSLVDHDTEVLWSVWARKTPMLETKPNPNEVSSPTGMIWKRSGTTPTTTSSELPQKNAQPFSPKLHSTQKLTEKR